MSDRQPLITAQTADVVKRLKRRAPATKQVVQDPVETITVWRSATVAVATFTPITIVLGGLQPRDEGANTGMANTVESGTLQAWADDAATVQQGDRFVWQGQPCTVSTGLIESYGTVTIAFALDIRNRGV